MSDGGGGEGAPTLTGGCLCGDVRYEVTGRVSEIQLCHCGLCRKATGSAFIAQLVCRANRLRFVTGEELVEVFELPVREEPPGYGRTFCRRCGALLPAVRDGSPFAVIPAGSLDGDPGTRVFRQIFTDHRAPWFELDERIETSFPGRLPPEHRVLRR